MNILSLVIKAKFKQTSYISRINFRIFIQIPTRYTVKKKKQEIDPHFKQPCPISLQDIVPVRHSTYLFSNVQAKLL